MLDYAAFSALRLERVFPLAQLKDYPSYRRYEPARASYDIEYQGDSWDIEKIDGVDFWYPASEGESLGIVEVWASHLVALGRRYRDAPDSNTTSIVASWKANADRVLEALNLPVRMGDSAESLQQATWAEWQPGLIPGTVWASPYAADSRSPFKMSWFLVRAPGLYHIAATTHEKDGLVFVEIRRADLIPTLDEEDGDFEGF